MLKRLISWLYWRFCWREDRHNRKLVVVITQHEVNDDSARVLMARVADRMNGEPVALTGLRVYSGRGKLVIDEAVNDGHEQGL